MEGRTQLLGRVAAQFPHLVGIGIDDFTLNLVGYGGTFRPPLVAAMTAELRGSEALRGYPASF